MKLLTKALLVFAALLLLLTFFVPLWQISLEAPQYPEGLGLYIHLHTITGQEPNHLKLINGLNHYIGMQAIVPESIPELRILPYVVGFLVLFGLVTALANRKKLIIVWLALLTLVATAGMIDFYLWEYDYGHDLDLENASIKIPGMSYQPPLIGSKKLLNFTAHSYPATGGWLAVATFAFAFAALLNERRKNQSGTTAHAAKISTAALLLMSAVLAAGCTPSAEPIAYGKDGCAHCKMTIVDARFAAELVMKTGKVYKYDAIECLAAASAQAAVPNEKVHALLVADFVHPETFLDAGTATFLRSENIRSPMSMNVCAFATQQDADTMIQQAGGEILNWRQVVELANAGWQTGRQKTNHHMNHMQPKP
ncbi:nitrous oxide reductase accessory protein NosL [candidate division KSB1 bacterium]|nr:nitrous oxide reductase accessory protein NosL [candidate division KSB1 bacterium]